MGLRTTVPPCVVEAPVRKVGEFGEDVEDSFPDEVPHELRTSVSISDGPKGEGAPYQVFHHEGKNKIQQEKRKFFETSAKRQSVFFHLHRLHDYRVCN